jgi:Domain of unknown function (DUF5050)
MARSIWPLLALIGIFVAGCGGGGGGSSVKDPIGAVGPFAVQGRVTTAPVSLSTSSIQATAVTGTFSGVTLHDDNPNTAGKLPIYYSVYSQGIYSANPDGSDEKLLVAGNQLLNLAVSSTGTKLFYLDTASSTVYTVSNKGGTPTAFLTGVRAFALSPTNKYIAYDLFDGTHKIYVAAIDKSNPVFLDSNSSWQPDITFMSDNTIAYRKVDGRIYQINVDGTQKSTINDGLVSRSGLRATTDGRFLAWLEYSSDVTRYIIKLAAIGQNGRISYIVNADPGRIITSFSFSPDSRSILINTDRDIYQALIAYPTNLNYLTGSQSMPPLYEAAYGRNPVDRMLVGTGAQFGSQLSAFIYALRDTSGTGVSSFVGFDATTPSSVVVTPGQIVADQRYLNFTVEADQFTKLMYSTDLNWNTATGLKSGVPVNGAIVSLDSRTGKVASVVTYQASRSAKPEIRQSAGHQFLIGNFVQTFDRTGTDHGPQTQVEIR